MQGRELVQALHEGRHVFGTFLIADSPRWPGAAKGLGLDFVFIDTEHIPLDRWPASWMCQAYRSVGVAPIVRIPSPDHYRATMALDAGACGVIAPYVESVGQVQELVGATKYRPLRGQRLQRILAGEEAIEPELAGYIEEHNAGHVLIVNIESRPAMDALDDILAVPGLDAVLIGPHDLSTSLGIPEQYDAPAFVSAVEEIIGKARDARVGAGIHVTFPDKIDQEIRWAQRGANLVVHSSDFIAFRLTMQRELATLRDALGRGR